HLLLDGGSLQDGEQFLAGTAKRTLARASATTAAAAGLVDGGLVTVSTEHGALTARLVVTAMPDYVVWLPTNAPDCAIRSTLRADAGAVVRLAAAVTSPAATRTDNSEVSA
ncbi:MAG: NADH-quinone oxidoreductase subunit G, partial [Cellulomonas sp.]|nr:NADH-quinone oxidoreductase subunit G [Cellulomonas sp.]